MIQRLTITLLAVLFGIQLSHMGYEKRSANSSEYTATERPEPARLLSGSTLPKDLTMRIRRIDQGKCTIVVFASPTCPGSAILAKRWDYGLAEPV